MQVLGACACHEGWGGSDCSRALAEPSWPPAWLVYSAVAASTLVSMVLWLASRQLLSDYIERRRQAQDENQAMLVRGRCQPIALYSTGLGLFSASIFLLGSSGPSG